MKYLKQVTFTRLQCEIFCVNVTKAHTKPAYFVAVKIRQQRARWKEREGKKREKKIVLTRRGRISMVERVAGSDQDRGEKGGTVLSRRPGRVPNCIVYINNDTVN